MDERWLRSSGSNALAPVGAAPVTWTRTLEFDRFDRMLLTTDGTVTTLLEACTGEPIVTRTTRQSGPAPLDELRASPGCWWHPSPELLEVVPFERLLARRVTLSGARSGIAYVMAEALVAPDRLPELTAHALLRPGASLGRLLAEGRLETRRELLGIERGASRHRQSAPRRPIQHEAGPAHVPDRAGREVGGRRQRVALPRTPRWLGSGRNLELRR